MTTAKPRAQHTTNLMTDTPREGKRRTLGLPGSLLVTFMALFSASCGGNNGSSPDMGTRTDGSGAGGSGSGAGASGSVAISIGTVASPSAIAGITPGAERYFLTVQATLHDVSAPAPIPVGFAHYTLATAHGLVIIASTTSEVVSMPCALDTSVSAGAEYTCTIAFEVPAGDSPARLSYDDQQGDTATTPISYTVPPPPVSAACNTFATYQNTVADACMSCIGAQCASQSNAFAAQEDGNTCPSAATACAACPPFPSSAGYCSCADGCLGGCQPAFDALYQCYVDHCAADCM